MLITDLSLLCSLLLTGFYGGTGFFIAIGGNPALKRLSDRSFAEYWQNIDRYMGARMPVFGPLLLLSNLITALLLLRAGSLPAMWLVLASLTVLVADLVFTLKTNHPLNKLIQSWDLNKLPLNVTDVKLTVIKAFTTRKLLMMAAFVLTLLAEFMAR